MLRAPTLSMRLKPFELLLRRGAGRNHLDVDVKGVGTGHWLNHGDILLLNRPAQTGSHTQIQNRRPPKEAAAGTESACFGDYVANPAIANAAFAVSAWAVSWVRKPWLAKTVTCVTKAASWLAAGVGFPFCACWSAAWSFAVRALPLPLESPPEATRSSTS